VENKSVAKVRSSGGQVFLLSWKFYKTSLRWELPTSTLLVAASRLIGKMEHFEEEYTEVSRPIKHEPLDEGHKSEEEKMLEKIKFPFIEEVCLINETVTNLFSLKTKIIENYKQKEKYVKKVIKSTIDENAKLQTKLNNKEETILKTIAENEKLMLEHEHDMKTIADQEKLLTENKQSLTLKQNGIETQIKELENYKVIVEIKTDETETLQRKVDSKENDIKSLQNILASKEGEARKKCERCQDNDYAKEVKEVKKMQNKIKDLQNNITGKYDSSTKKNNCVEKSEVIVIDLDTSFSSEEIAASDKSTITPLQTAKEMQVETKEDNVESKFSERFTSSNTKQESTLKDGRHFSPKTNFNDSDFDDFDRFDRENIRETKAFEQSQHFEAKDQEVVGREGPAASGSKTQRKRRSKSGSRDRPRPGPPSKRPHLELAKALDRPVQTTINIFGLATHNFLRGNRDEYAKALYSLDTVESIHFCNINTEGRRSRDYMGSYLPMTVTLLTRHPKMWKHNKGFRESQLSLVNSRLERGALREHIHNDRGGHHEPGGHYEPTYCEYKCQY